MQSDSRKQEFNPDNAIGNDDAINNVMMSEIEKELQDNPYDMISLVFLLYDVPDTALQRLIVFERISKDVGVSTNLNMLHEWFRHAKHTPTWKHEFLEALLLCQQYSTVRKLGFHVPSVLNHYQTDNMHMKKYINPVKKVLYKLCENMNADNLSKLKKTLLTYKIDTTDYESCELVLLKLMCEKFITVGKFQNSEQIFGSKTQLDKLVRIIENLPGLQMLAQDIRNLQYSINDDAKPADPVAVSTPSAPLVVDECNENIESQHLYHNDFDDVYDMFKELSLECDLNFNDLKSDRKKLDSSCFNIKNPDRVGVCVILNQVNFHPSKDSLDNPNQANTLLSTRKGSDKDKAVIEKTMSALKFKVYSAPDLTHTQIFDYLKEILKHKVCEEDSVFVLCVLSHGVKGHIFAADSVKVNVDDFQALLDSDIAAKLHGKPKMLIIQACQAEETQEKRMVADNPKSNQILKKINFLIFWATAPKLEAYRDEKQGSIFIQLLCHSILRFIGTEHICDIFTRVTDVVSDYCERKGYDQVPLYQSTFRKKLYLHHS